MDGAQSKTVRVIDSNKECPSISIILGEGSAKVIAWPGNGARYRTFHLLTLKDGSRTIALNHPTDSVYYVVGGSGIVTDLNLNVVTPLEEGCMIHIDRSDAYEFEAKGPGGMKLLGGPCPADDRLYASLVKA